MYLKVLAFGAVALGLAAMSGPSRAMPVAPLGSAGIDSGVVEVGHKASHRRTTCVCPRTSSRGRVYGYREGYAPGATGRTYSYTERRYGPGRYGYHEEGRTYGGRYGTRYERSRGGVAYERREGARGGAVYGERGARTRGEEGAIGRSVSPGQRGQQMQQRGKGMEPRGAKGEQPQGATTEKRSAQPGGTTDRPAGQQGSPMSKQPMQGGGTRGPSGPGGQSAPSGGGAPGGSR